MIHMSAYGSFYALYLYGLLLIPAVLLGLFGKNSKYYGMIISLPLLYSLLGISITRFLVFVAGEFLLLSFFYVFRKHCKSELVYYLVVLASIAPVVFIKYAIAKNIHEIAFLGVSYMSFRIWQMIVEIHDGHVDKFRPFDILYFITFFPTLSSGPIDRLARFVGDLENKVSGSTYANEYLAYGLKKILKGVIYKFGLANFLFVFVMSKIPTTDITWQSTLAYMYVYTFYLYFDFAGYSDMAIGTSYLLGIKAPENFNQPFLAKSMKELWERWHMSLSRWFGDYVFSRFVLNVLRSGMVKKQSTAARMGFFVTMTLMGCWHGFTLYYVIYGMYHGLGFSSDRLLSEDEVL
jgi:membrane protein involved in D-alanine export